MRSTVKRAMAMTGAAVAIATSGYAVTTLNNPAVAEAANCFGSSEAKYSGYTISPKGGGWFKTRAVCDGEIAISLATPGSIFIPDGTQVRVCYRYDGHCGGYKTLDLDSSSKQVIASGVNADTSFRFQFRGTGVREAEFSYIRYA
jgi:hypothetical protein